MTHATIQPEGTEQRAAIVSGGSRGLGAALCEHLLEQGWRVASFARSQTSEAERLMSEYPSSVSNDATEEFDVGAFLFEEIDATDYSAVEDFVRRFSSSSGRLDLLVNNAAIGQDSLLVHTRPTAISQIIKTNIEAPIFWTRLAAREMLKRGGIGQVVNIGSICARTGYPGLSAYAASKGAVESFSRSLAREFEGRLIVNTLAPGFFESDMSAVLRPEQKASIVRRTPSGRLSTAGDVVAVFAMLIEGSSNLNGSVIDIDGGATV